MFQWLIDFYIQLREIYPPRPKFTVDDIPDQTGKVAIVTGGYSGIGKLIVKYLLRKNATVYVAGRSRTKGEEAVEELKKETGNDKVHFMLMDLGDLESIKHAVEEFRQKGERLDQLYNNAGVMIPPVDQVTQQGYDLTWGTNLIGNGYVTILFLPILLASAKTVPDGKVRVINTSSNAHWFAPKGGIDWDWVEGKKPADSKTSPPPAAYDRYSMSKWAVIEFSFELAKRYGSQGIVSLVQNPGSVITPVNRHTPAFMRWMLEHLVQWKADPYGALAPLWAGTAPETAELNGKFLSPWGRVGTPRSDVWDENTWKKVYDHIEEEGNRVA
ncbi:NADP-binding protein [Dacryopinax primogenitus]|uniref:NADP-binding protein n=1 Tax=Dacryopinax primogenitus (strain DJM 731) TaxID=1858805 RepID=M5FUA2_DACPD|nr:NADP-binding protein [Dacryopinax primogenitus]EJU01291.1 NADP-binding protein [Dacryopinax primogenitus]